MIRRTYKIQPRAVRRRLAVNRRQLAGNRRQLAGNRRVPWQHFLIHMPQGVGPTKCTNAQFVAERWDYC